MANRLETEFPKMNLRLTPPLIGPDGLQRGDLAREAAWLEGAGRRSWRDPQPSRLPSLWVRLSHAFAALRAEFRRPPALTPHYR